MTRHPKVNVFLFHVTAPPTFTEIRLQLRMKHCRRHVGFRRGLRPSFGSWLLPLREWISVPRDKMSGDAGKQLPNYMAPNVQENRRLIKGVLCNTTSGYDTQKPAFVLNTPSVP